MSSNALIYFYFIIFTRISCLLCFDIIFVLALLHFDVKVLVYEITW